MEEIAFPPKQGFISAAGQVTERVAESAGRLADKALRLIFDFEAFKPLLSTKKSFQPFPFAEMLARHPDGQSAGHIFDEARKYDCVVKTDLIAFKRAVKTQMDLGIPVSINLNAETFFSEELKQALADIAIEYPSFNPADICLESTEQGGVPKNFDAQTLTALKEMGFKLAMDDFNPGQAVEIHRLDVYAPHMDVIKFPHEIMAKFRDGNLQQDALKTTIDAIKSKFPNIKFVMEGVRSTDDDLLPGLEYAGIDYIQATKYVEPAAKISHLQNPVISSLALSC